MDHKTTVDPNFTIHRLEHDVTGEDYAHIEFERKGDRPRGTITERVSVASNPKRLQELLLDHGADLPLRGENGVVFPDPMVALPDDAGVLTASVGWKGAKSGRWFIMPKGIYGQRSGLTVLSEAATKECLAREMAGTLKCWREEVAQPVTASVAAATAMLVALAGPLYEISEIQESFIFNIAGNGSSGKSSAIAAAASIWGNPLHVSGWYASPRALTEAAAANNALCLVLDDVERADPDPKLRIKKVQEFTHLLTSGKGKAYAHMVSGADQLPPLEFRCFVLSSSPKSIEETLVATGEKRTDGDRARLLEYQVEHGDLGGIWYGPDKMKAAGATFELSDALSAAARRNYGVAGRSFVQFLVGQQADLDVKTRKYVATFRKKAGGDALGSVEGRIANKVALLYAAGRLGMKASVLPWSKAQVMSITIAAFHGIIAASNLNTFDPQSLVPRLRTAFVDRRQYPRVAAKTVSKFALPAQANGCLHGGNLYVRLDAFKRALGVAISDSHCTEVIDYLVSSGALARGEGGGPTKTIRFEGSKPKMMVFSWPVLNQLPTGAAKGSVKGK